MAHVSPVGAVLKQWRTYRRMSQLDLAAHAEISTRHLSCVETGKSRASPEMLLVLASALEMPLEERNRLLQAGGYAPAYPNSDVSPASGEVDRALRVILDGVDPNPTLVVNSRWDLVRLNRGAATLFSAVSPGFGDLLASVRGTAPVSVLALPPLNLMHVMLNDPGVKRALLDWEDVVAVTVDRLHREAAAYPGPDGPAETLRACLAAPDIPNRLRRPELAHPPRAFVQLRFSVPTASRSLAFFTTLSTLGTTIDVAASRLMIETYFPADEFTRDWLSEHVE
ncbi:MAG: helix-turn-helix transcriptional regulator [Myxococcota bacterium]